MSMFRKSILKVGQLRIGTSNKWSFVSDPCDHGNPLCTILRNGTRVHFNPGADPVKVLTAYDSDKELTDDQVSALLQLRPTSRKPKKPTN